mgnify:FL=1
MKNVSRLSSRNKDWNEDLKEMHGIHPAPAREHPGLLTCMKLCLWLKNQEDKLCTDEEALKQIQDSFHHLSMAMERQVTYGEDHGAEMLMCWKICLPPDSICCWRTIETKNHPVQKSSLQTNCLNPISHTGTEEGCG